MLINNKQHYIDELEAKIDALQDKVDEQSKKLQRKTSQIKNVERKYLDLKNVVVNEGSLRKGFQVVKKSLRPFKSGKTIGTVKGYCFHPTTENLCYVFEEDDSYVEIRMCKEVQQ